MNLTLKSVLAAVWAAVAFALIGVGAGHAATFGVTVTANPFRDPGQPGLQTRAVVLNPTGPQEFTSTHVNFDLHNLGDSVTFDLYGLVHYDAPLDPDDLTPRPTSATFDFGGALGSLTIWGNTFAFPTSPGVAVASFLSDVIRISSNQGILISISDTFFGNDGTSFVDGRAGMGVVQATFTLAAVPLPAGFPLLAGALGLLGVMRLRKRGPAPRAKAAI